MHHRLRPPILRVDHCLLTGVLKTCLFEQRQSVKVGAEQDRWALAIGKDAEEAMAADVLCHLDGGGEITELLGDEGGSFGLLERDFGIGVEVSVESFIGGEGWNVLEEWSCHIGRTGLGRRGVRLMLDREGVQRGFVGCQAVWRVMAIQAVIWTESAANQRAAVCKKGNSSCGLDNSVLV